MTSKKKMKYLFFHRWYFYYLVDDGHRFLFLKKEVKLDEMKERGRDKDTRERKRGTEIGGEMGQEGGDRDRRKGREGKRGGTEIGGKEGRWDRKGKTEIGGKEGRWDRKGGIGREGGRWERKGGREMGQEGREGDGTRRREGEGDLHNTQQHTANFYSI